MFLGDDCVESLYHMFMNACWSDAAVGGTVLALALFMMFVSENVLTVSLPD